MKNLFLTTLTLFSLSVFAGDKGGNGGIVVKCDNDIQLAEYYEAKTLPGFGQRIEMIESDEAVEIQVIDAFNKLKPFVKSDDFQIMLKSFKALKVDINWSKGNLKWNFTNDLGPFAMNEACSSMNVINYFEDDFIEGNELLYEKLSNSQKAALYVHEVVYKMTRKLTAQNTSLGARRIVTHLFSKNLPSEILAGLIAHYFYTDKSASATIYTTPADSVLTLNSLGSIFTKYFVFLREHGLQRNLISEFLGNRSLNNFRLKIPDPRRSYSLRISYVTTSTYVGRNILGSDKLPNDFAITIKHSKNEENFKFNINQQDLEELNRIESGEITLHILPESVREFVRGRL